MRPLRIGLTGGIGSGKSTVAALLVERGCVRVQQCAHVRARRSGVVAGSDHAGDLGEGQTGGLGGPNEPQSVQRSLVVVAVPRRPPRRRRQQTGLLVEPQGLGRQAGPLGELSDAHPDHATT